MVRKRDIKVLKDFKKKLAKNFQVEKIILFGSRANGKTHEWSDFDIIVVSRKFEGMVSYVRSAKMYDFWDSDYPVDFLCYTPKEFNRLKK